jgi:hypothetical protein
MNNQWVGAIVGAAALLAIAAVSYLVGFFVGCGALPCS